MFDKNLFEKICKVTCTLDELEAFNREINKKEFDLENPFAKYYNLNSILHCINLQIKGFVTDKFLAYWANAFNWIIMGGFKTKYNDDTEKSISLETLLIWEISDWLDSLSFFDGDTEFLNLDDYKNTFTSLNSIYKNPDKWTIYYAFTNEEYDNGEPVNSIVVLLINEKKNLYAPIYSEGCDFKDYPLEKAHLVDDIEKEEKRLKENNYKRLQIGSN